MTIIIAVGVMLTLCLLRVNVILALITSAIAGGFSAGMNFSSITTSFTHGISHSAVIALSYGLLGAFANALSYSGITEKVALIFQSNPSKNNKNRKLFLLFSLFLMAIASQNIIPIHIAFIPIIVPPLLYIFNQMQLDRRLVSCIITFGITFTYMTVPVGFGNIYLEQVLGKNLAINGLHVAVSEIPYAMLLPSSGMIVGLLIAIFFSYKKPRKYTLTSMKFTSIKEEHLKPTLSENKKIRLISIILSISITLIIQLYTNSMIMGALAGCLTIIATGILPIKKTDAIFMEGFKIMAPCSLIMLAAAGLAGVLQDSGSIPNVVQTIVQLVPNKGILIFLMLLVGLLVTMGIGSSFSTIPIIAAIYVPMAMDIGLSQMATVALIGTAGALGDAGSPASDSTIGPTSGLNMDGQHDHIRDTVIPTFIHYNIPLLISGWISVMIL